MYVFMYVCMLEHHAPSQGPPWDVLGRLCGDDGDDDGDDDYDDGACDYDDDGDDHDDAHNADTYDEDEAYNS